MSHLGAVGRVFGLALVLAAAFEVWYQVRSWQLRSFCGQAQGIPEVSAREWARHRGFRLEEWKGTKSIGSVGVNLPLQWCEIVIEGGVITAAKYHRP